MQKYFLCCLFAFLPKEVFSDNVSNYEELTLYFQLIENVKVINEKNNNVKTEKYTVHYENTRRRADETDETDGADRDHKVKLSMYYDCTEPQVEDTNNVCSIVFTPKRLSETEISPIYYGTLRKCLDKKDIQMLSAYEINPRQWSKHEEEYQFKIVRLENKVKNIEKIYGYHPDVSRWHLFRKRFHGRKHKDSNNPRDLRQIVNHSLIRLLEKKQPFTLYVNNNDQIERYIFASRTDDLNQAINTYWRARERSSLCSHKETLNYGDFKRNNPRDLVNILFNIAAGKSGDAIYQLDDDKNNCFVDTLFLVDSHFSIYKGEILFSEKKEFYLYPDPSWATIIHSHENKYTMKVVLAVHPEDQRDDKTQVAGSCFSHFGKKAMKNNKSDLCGISYLFILSAEPTVHLSPENSVTWSPEITAERESHSRSPRLQTTQHLHTVVINEESEIIGESKKDLASTNKRPIDQRTDDVKDTPDNLKNTSPLTTDTGASSPASEEQPLESNPSAADDELGLKYPPGVGRVVNELDALINEMEINFNITPSPPSDHATPATTSSNTP